MRAIYNAFYFIIFVAFLRRIVDKVKAPLEHDIQVERRDSSDCFYIMANGKAIAWEDCKESAMVFCWNACAKCKSLCTKLKIVETEEELVLVDTASIPGLSLDEIVALDDTIDESA